MRESAATTASSRCSGRIGRSASRTELVRCTNASDPSEWSARSSMHRLGADLGMLADEADQGGGVIAERRARNARPCEVMQCVFARVFGRMGEVIERLRRNAGRASCAGEVLERSSGQARPAGENARAAAPSSR